MLDVIAQTLGARAARRQERIQSLWSGYGEIVRVGLEGGACASVIVKHIDPPNKKGLSHRRKVRSYAIERTWYQRYSGQLDPERCRAPGYLGWVEEPPCLLLEDLDAAGYPERRGAIEDALRWLAHFHATFLGVSPKGLWATGTYWHLATRPDELAAIRDARLARAASSIDARLNAARYQTLVHGDAKLANFCWGVSGVAAVDFQYVGGGCGMKDVAYLLSCLDDVALQRGEGALLDLYFNTLREALRGAVDADALEGEWRELYPWAWADFMRFLAGWSPGYFASSRHGHRHLKTVLTLL